MRKPVFAAGCLVVAGAFWAPLASAAPALVLKVAPAPPTSLERGHPIVNLGLGSVVGPVGALDISTGASRAVQFDLTRSRNWDASADLFPGSAELNSAYLSGTNMRASAAFALGHDTSLTVSHVALGLGALSLAQPSDASRDLAERLGSDIRSLGTTSASLNWNFTDWGGVAITASQSNAGAALLANVPATLRNAGAADSSAMGISARVGFGEGWVTTLTYAEGVSQLDLSRDKLVAGDSVVSQGYGIGLAKKGLFGDDALGIALSRPLQIYTGGNNLSALNTNFALANTQARESDVELGYVTTFLDGTIALQANAAYQLNAAGARGQNAVAGVARAKLNF